jgi:predicted nucleic acid-binding protein
MRPHDVAGAVRRDLPRVFNVTDAVVRLAVAWPALTRDPEMLRHFAEKMRAGNRLLTDDQILDLAIKHGGSGVRCGIPWAWDGAHRQVSRERYIPQGSKP